MSTSRIVASLAIAAAVAALVGCPGSLENPERFSLDGGTSTSCPDVPTSIFAKSCALDGCHLTAESASGNLDLASPGLPERLVGQKASGGAGLLIDPANPLDSVILTKLKKPVPFGSQMPLGSALPDDQIECVRAWVQAAAAGAGDAGGGDSGAEAGDDAADATDDGGDASDDAATD